MSLDPDFIEKLSGTLGNVLKSHLEAEQSPSSGNDMGLDVFINDFEDEFPRDPDDPALGSYPTYSEEANRAAKEEPYGLKRGDRPKVWELNQPPPSRVRGWRVVDLYPNREIKSEFYRLAGTPSEIRMMAQLIRHTQELVKKFGSGSINFEEWFKQWADGWETLTNRSNPALNLTTNYPALDSAKVDPATGTSTTIERWRTPATKPGYIEWKDPLGKGVDGYKVIEYFPSKNDATTSVIFSGSDTDIINHIIRYHSSAQGVGDGDGEDGWIGESPLMGGHPMVTLYFAASQRLPGHRMLTRSRISFRMMDKIESAEYAFSGESVLSKADIEQLVQRIKTKYTSTSYVIKRGDVLCSYTQKQIGYRFWNPLQNREEAVRIYSDILSLRDHILKPELIKDDFTPARASTIPDKQLTVLGEKQTIRIGYKKEDLLFTHATLHLPISRQRKTLIVSRVAEKNI